MVHHAYEVYLGIGIIILLIALKNVLGWNSDLEVLIGVLLLFVGARLGVRLERRKLEVENEPST